MMTMTQKKRAVVSIVLFAVIFASLLITATFTDFQVSSILTSKALAGHTYYTNDAFGAAFESFGCTPIYLVLAFSFQIFFWYGFRSKKFSLGLKTVVSGVSLALSVVANFVLFNETMGYILRHLEMEGAASEGYLIITEAFITAVVSFLGLFAVRNFSDESIEKLVRFAIAAIYLTAVSTLMINLIKNPVGRIRFRAMNMYPGDEKCGFANFARWYEVNGQWIPKDEMITLFGTSDALRSFPSGHTSEAGCSYALIMLNDALGIKNKKVRTILWILPILFTGTVAVSRIVVGAHFFSDVLVGGTISFVCMIILREIFICKGSNVKLLFGKN